MVTTTKFIWDEDNYLAETDGADAVQAVYTNEPQRYGNLVSQRRGAATQFFHFDATSSTRQLTNASSTTIDNLLYSAWGSLLLKSGADEITFQWIGALGYYRDIETSSYWIRMRSMRPCIASWQSVDPLHILEIAMHPYQYCRNSPVNHSDPSGLIPSPAPIWNYIMSRVAKKVVSKVSLVAAKKNVIAQWTADTCCNNKVEFIGVAASGLGLDIGELSRTETRTLSSLPPGTTGKFSDSFHLYYNICCNTTPAVGTVSLRGYLVQSLTLTDATGTTTSTKITWSHSASADDGTWKLSQCCKDCPNPSPLPR